MALPRSNPSSLVTLATAVIVIAALVFAKEILLPIAVAILLSFVLTPVAEWIERWGLGRVPSVALVVVLAFTILGGIGWIVTTQVIDLSQKMTNYESNVVAKIRAIAPSSATFNRMTTVLEDVGKQLTEPPSENGQTSPPGPAPRQTGKSAPATSPATSSKTLPEHSDDAVEVKVVEMPPSPLAQVQTWLGPLVAPLTTAGIVVVLVLFMLIHREDQRNRLIRLFGAANLHTTTEALNDAATRISRYLRMQFLINAGYGILVGLGLSIIGVPNAIMWGVVGFALRFLPYIGPWMAAVTPIAVSLAVSPGWTQPLLVIGWYVILEVIAANVVEPWLYGQSVGVSGLGIILAAIVWTWLWGPIGLVLAVPLTVCLVVLAQYIPQLRFIAVLLGDQPTLTMHERIYQRLLAFDDDEARELATKQLASSSLAQLYDQVLIPVLVIAERDKQAEVLRDDQVEFAQDFMEDLVDEVGQAPQPATTTAEPPTHLETEAAPLARVLCVPLHDQNDHTSTLMLSQLLTAEGFHADLGSVDSLTNELVDNVAKLGADVVFISLLPPAAPRQTRLLRKRLRARYPTLPIIVGYWNGSDDANTLRRSETDANFQLVTTLDEAVAAVRTAAPQFRPTPVASAAS